MLEHPEPRKLARRNPRPTGPGDACLAVDTLLEPFADGDLDRASARRVERHVAECADCAEQLRLAERVRTSLRALPQLTCPAHIVFEAPPERWTERWASRLTGRSGGRSWSLWASPPVWAATAAVALISLSLGIGYLERPLNRTAIGGPGAMHPGTVPAVDPEVVRAEAEVKLALAYLGRIGARTGDIVAEDVLESRVAVPIVRSVQKALAPTHGLGHASARRDSNAHGMPPG